MDADLHTLVREYARRVWNEHDLDALDDFAPEYTMLLDREGDERVSREQLKIRVQEVLYKMPDHRLDVGTIIAEGDRVIFNWVNTGNWRDGNRGSFPVCFGGITYWQIVDGRIAIRDGLGDIATFAWQIGVVKTQRIRLLMPV